MTARSSGLRRPAFLLIAGTLVVGSSFAAAIALGRDDQAPIGAADPSARPASSPVVTVRPSVSPTAAPSLAPSVAPSLAPTPTPSKPPRDAMPMTVDLETLTSHHVHVDIVDSSGTLVSAVSGTPTASAAVEPYTLLVENIDPQTLRLTWVDRPGDNALALYIDEGVTQFLMVQPEHDTDGDAIVHDRVLVLTFDHPVDGSAIQTSLQEGLDTAG